MSVSYKRLWHLLIDKDMKKKDLMEKANISDYTIRKLNRGDNVTTDVLVRICHALDCHIEDIMEVLPEDKASYVAAEHAAGRTVIMLGDGINDSSALARADVSIAMGNGTDIAIETAMVTLPTSDLQMLPRVVRLSKKTMRIVHQNLFWAFIYNIIGIPIAAGIFYPAFGFKLSPMIGALAMSFSSVFVVTNALRLRFFSARHSNHKN